MQNPSFKSPSQPSSKQIVDAVTGYDLWSKSYDTFDNPMIAMCELALDRSPLNLRDMHVVELGCGTGRNFDRVMKEGARSYTGVDGSTGMLEQASRRATSDSTASTSSWINARLGDQLPIPSGSADLVLVTLVFEHVESLEPALSEAHRILASSGVIRIIEMHDALHAKGTGAHFWHEGTELSLPSFAHSSRELAKSLTAAGFSIDRIIDWYAPESLVERLPKLAKHRGSPILLDVQARKLD